MPRSSEAEWEKVEPKRQKGKRYESDEYALEVYPSNGSGWVAELLHEYGCTRVVVEETEKEIDNRLKEKYEHFPPQDDSEE